jgi:ParB family chromosome partitioning protein
MVMLESLRPNPYQPRLHPIEDDAALAALVADIKEYGFRGSIEVRRNPADPAGHPQIVAGHRRVEAAKRAGLTRVPAQFVDLDDAQMQQSAIRENLLREDLTPWEEAVFLKRLRDDGLTYDQIATYCGKSTGWVQNRLRLHNLEGPLLEAAMTDPELLTALNTLLFLDPDDREALFARVQAGELNVEDLRNLVKARRRARRAEEEAITPGGGRRIDVPLPAPPPAGTEAVGAPAHATGEVRPIPPRGATAEQARPDPGTGPAPEPGSAAKPPVMPPDEVLRAVFAHLEGLKRHLPALAPAWLTPAQHRRLRDDLAVVVALWGRRLGEQE